MSGLGIFLKSATKSGSTTKLGLAGMNQASSLLISIYSASGFSLSHRNVLPQQQTSSIFFILYNASKIQGRLALPQRARDSSLCGDRCQFFSLVLPWYSPFKKGEKSEFKCVFYSTTDKVIPTFSIPRAFKSTSFLVASQSILNLISLKPDERITKPLKLNLSYESSLISWSSSLGGWMESS